jgi:hypothetical protein
MSFLVAAAVALGTFLAGVMFSDKIKAWFTTKALPATVRELKAEEAKVVAKL